MSNRKIVVLGAGASIGSNRYPIESSMSKIRDRMPSAENFFYDLFQVNKTDNRESGHLNFLGLTYENLNELLTKSWNINNDGFDADEWKGVNIEEVMTFFETGSKMYPEGSNEQKVFKSALDRLIAFMNPFIPMICDGQHCEYLLDIFYTLDKKDTIISYNWDTIADFTLEKMNADQLKNYAKLMRSEDIKPEDFRDTGLLLKLHGSFNWMVCSNSECERINMIQPPFKKNRYKLLSMRETWRCPNCGSNKINPFIVPPVSDKMIHKNSFLKNQWLIAREKLLDVKELVFIGYSFPPTDFYTEWLFRQIHLMEETPDINIIVVNPEYGKRNSQVTKRFNTIFKGYDIQSYKYLKDYANNL